MINCKQILCIMLSKFCNVYLFKTLYLLWTLHYHQEHYLFTFQFHFSHNELSLQVSPNMFTSSTVGLPDSSWHHTVYQIFKLWQHEFKMNLSKADVVKREIEKLVISLSSCYFCQIDIISASQLHSGQQTMVASY